MTLRLLHLSFARSSFAVVVYSLTTVGFFLGVRSSCVSVDPQFHAARPLTPTDTTVLKFPKAVSPLRQPRKLGQSLFGTADILFEALEMFYPVWSRGWR